MFVLVILVLVGFCGGCMNFMDLLDFDLGGYWLSVGEVEKVFVGDFIELVF